MASKLYQLKVNQWSVVIVGLISQIYHHEQEEADTRIVLHAQDPAKRGCNRVMARIVDTDVVVLCVSMMEQMDATKLWIAFGVGKGFRYLSAESISHASGKEKSKDLFRCFMLLQDVMKPHFSQAKERKPHGLHGKFLMMSQRLSPVL